MAHAPVFHIDPVQFNADPYPALKEMRAKAPIAYVPELDAVLLTKREDVFVNEKKTDVFSSEQPGGLMTVLMGENMMRKDGEPHMSERRAIFPTVSPKTVKNIWIDHFTDAAKRLLGDLVPRGQGDLVLDFAMPLSAEALRVITGLTNMQNEEMDRTSQGMIDGVSNYSGDKAIEANCNNCTASIDAHITAMMPVYLETPNSSLLSVQMQAGLSDAQIRANIKLAISGGQNEPRDAIAGTIYALLSNPDQLAAVKSGEVSWLHAFEEYARWMSPIGMSPRRIAKPYTYNGIDFSEGSRAFLMFGSANRDEDVFDTPDVFDLAHDTGRSIAFGAGPHFCAGAWAARALIADVALPMAFEALPGLRLVKEAPAVFTGWAFRGPKSLQVEWDDLAA